MYGYIEAWTYSPMLNISVIPQRKYNLAPAVRDKLYTSRGAKVKQLHKVIQEILFCVSAKENKKRISRTPWEGGWVHVGLSRLPA